MSFKVRVIANWKYDFNYELDAPVDFYVDCLRGCEAITDSTKILILFEPDNISKVKSQVLHKYKNFDYILTHNEEILNKCNNSILFEFGSTWIEDDYSFPKKKL